MRGVMVGDQDDSAFGVRRAELGHHLVETPAAENQAQPAAAVGRQVIDGGGRREGTESRGAKARPP
jgi:hypothetical protein